MIGYQYTKTYFDSEFDSQSTELLNFSVSNDNEYLFLRIKLGNEIDLTEAYVNKVYLFILMLTTIVQPDMLL